MASGPLRIPVRSPLALAAGGLAVAISAVHLLISLATNVPGIFNDFYDYWGAAVLLNRGHDPYDTAALTSVVNAAGLHSQVGGGYSYPLVLAQALRPLGLLDPHVAALVFSGVSLLALGVAVSVTLGGLNPLRFPTAIGGGIAAAFFPPVIGSLHFGQAGILILVPLAFAWRSVLPGPMIAAASAVKLFPATGFLAQLTRPSRASAIAILSGVGTLAALVLLAQVGAHGSLLEHPGSLLGPDTFWTNQSVNGWVSRLALPSNWTNPPLPQLPVTPVVAAVSAFLAAAVIVVLVRTRDAPAHARLALCLWLGVVVAPKNSFWNYTPLLFAAASVWRLRAGRWWPPILALIGWLLIEAQSHIDVDRDTFYRAGPGLTWLSSLALYGAIFIGGVLAHLLLSNPGRSGARYTRRALAMASAREQL